jgi:hypothetical protein
MIPHEMIRAGSGAISSLQYSHSIDLMISYIFSTNFKRPLYDVRDRRRK